LAALADALEAVADTGGSTSHLILTTLGLRDTTAVGVEARAVLDPTTLGLWRPYSARPAR
jgi:hypothetical protein